MRFFPQPITPAAAACLFACFICHPLRAQDKPARIVSLALCTDELVMQLADRPNIASVSYLAADPEYSSVAGMLGDIPLNRARAEEIIALDPDLILATRFSATTAVSLLRRLGHEVTVLDFPVTLADTYTQIRRVANLIGETGRGETLIRQMQQETGRILRSFNPGNEQLSAVFYTVNGFSYGRDTLRNHLLETLGIENIAATAGLHGPGKLPLETVIAARPDILIVDSPDPGKAPLAQQHLDHPAMKKLFGAGNTVVLHDKYFQCAGPPFVQAMARLAAALPAGSGK